MAELNTEFTPEDSRSIGNSATAVLVHKQKPVFECQSLQWSFLALWAGVMYLLIVYIEGMNGVQSTLEADVMGSVELILLGISSVEVWMSKAGVWTRAIDWLLLGTSAIQVIAGLMDYEGVPILKLTVTGRVLTAAYRLKSAAIQKFQSIAQVSDQLQALVKLPESQRQRKIHTGLSACIEALDSLQISAKSLNSVRIKTEQQVKGFDFFENELNAKEFAVFSEVGSIDFNIFTLKGLTHNCPLHALGGYLLIHRGLCAKLQIPLPKMNSLLVALETAYNPLPYHSSTHAADVMQAVHAFVKTELTEMEEFVLYLAAAAHDVSHPGRNNAFLVNTRDPLAVLYNDKSVLENHHVATLFTLMTDDNNEVLCRFSNNDYKQTRSALIEMVLFTDISEHSRLLSALQTTPFPAKSAYKIRSLHLSFLLHAGDISNPVRRWSLAHAWTQLILEECFDQGDEEIRLELPLGQLNDRNMDVARSQIGFIEHLVEPTFAILVEMMPATKELKEALARNKEAWKQKV